MPRIPQEMISPMVTVRKENHNGWMPYAYSKTNGMMAAFAAIGPTGAVHLYFRKA